MKPDIVLSWDQHLKNGNVWKVNVELSMQSIDIYVVAPTQALAQYIAATMYPDYESLCIDDEPTRTAP
jgi:hypothetical protein